MKKGGEPFKEHDVVTGCPAENGRCPPKDGGVPVLGGLLTGDLCISTPRVLRVAHKVSDNLVFGPKPQVGAEDTGCVKVRYNGLKCLRAGLPRF